MMANVYFSPVAQRNPGQPKPMTKPPANPMPLGKKVKV